MLLRQTIDEPVGDRDRATQHLASKGWQRRCEPGWLRGWARSARSNPSEERSDEVAGCLTRARG